MTIRGVSLWLSDSLRTRAGQLAPAAERFLGDWLGPEAAVYPGGARGLVGLCRHMEHWLDLEQVGEEDERRFVEGAGALLALLLIEHVGDARHEARGEKHRLRLGAHGYFDPFAAVERALDADDVRGELARQVGLAEAEARNEGPVSRVVSALLDAVARERPDLRLDDHFDLSLALRGGPRDERLEIDLERAVESTRDQGIDAVARVTDRLVTMLSGAREAELDIADVRQRLVPRLARADMLRELQGQAAGGLYATPLTGELVVALMLEYDGRARYVRTQELAAWAMSHDEALTLALSNLATRSSHARIACTETAHGALLVARTGDGRDSARVLLKSLHRALSARLGVGEVYVGIPHRDTFFACSGRNPELVRELARRTARDAERAPHRLSPRLFQLTATGVCE